MVLIRKISLLALTYLSLGTFFRLSTALFCGYKFEFFSDILPSLGIGMIYDLSGLSILLLLIFPFTFVLSSRWTIYVVLLFYYTWLLLSACDMLCLKYTGMRTSLFTLNLFSIIDLITKGFSLFALIPFLLVFLLGLYFNTKLVLQFTSLFEKGTIKQTSYFLLIVFASSLLYLPFPISYYTNQVRMSDAAKQLSFNPLYSWTSSFLYAPESYPIEPKKALEAFSNELGYIDFKKNGINRSVKYTDSSYNSVILIIMESFGANRIGALGGEKDLSPNFNALCKEGVLYNRCFACGPRTQYGMTSILYGFPHILNYNVFRQNKMRLPFHGLIQAMTDNGFANHFIHAGDAHYDDMDVFLNSDAPINVFDSKDMKPIYFKNNWGVDDESMFAFASNYIMEQKNKNFYVLLTMSNHEPFQVPNTFKIKTKVQASERSFSYSDYALGKFIEDLKRKGLYEKSLIIVTGDHGENYSNGDQETKLYNVPLLIIDHQTKGKLNAEITSHADIAEFILSKTTYSGTSHFIGQGLTSLENKHAYYRDYDNHLFMVTDSVIYKYSLSSNELLKLYYSPNMYVTKRVNVLTQSKEFQLASTPILSYYVSCKFLFENGKYTHLH